MVPSGFVVVGVREASRELGAILYELGGLAMAAWPTTITSRGGARSRRSADTRCRNAGLAALAPEWRSRPQSAPLHELATNPRALGGESQPRIPAAATKHMET